MVLSNLTSLTLKLPNLLSGLGGLTVTQKRTTMYYDRNTCEPHSDPYAVRRFFRLRWGGWIRPRAGFKRHLWRKPWHLRYWAGQHVFVRPDQAAMLERMIAPKYKKARYFIDDIYEPYHKRNNFDVCPAGQKKVETSYAKMMHQD